MRMIRFFCLSWDLFRQSQTWGQSAVSIPFCVIYPMLLRSNVIYSTKSLSVEWIMRTQKTPTPQRAVNIFSTSIIFCSVVRWLRIMEASASSHCVSVRAAGTKATVGKRVHTRSRSSVLNHNEFCLAAFCGLNTTTTNSSPKCEAGEYHRPHPHKIHMGTPAASVMTQAFISDGTTRRVQ